MKPSRLFVLKCTIAALLTPVLRADFVPLTLTPTSWNADVVVENTASSFSSALNATLDGGRAVTGATWYEQGLNFNSLTTGLPAGGSILTSAASPAAKYQLRSYTENNAIFLDGTEQTTTIGLAAPRSAGTLSFLTSTGSGSSTISITVNFSDGTPSWTGSSFASPDWYNGIPVAFSPNARVSNSGSDGFAFDTPGGGNPRLYQQNVSLPTSLFSHPIASIDLSFAGTGHTAILGVSALGFKTWSGAANSSWDTTSNNFSGSSYQQGDGVLFADVDSTGAAVTRRDITIMPGGVIPGEIVVENSNGAYKFTGAISNTKLIKNGTDSLTLSGTRANSDLRLELNQGTLILNKSSEAFASLSGAGTLTNAGVSATTVTIGSANQSSSFSGSIQNGSGVISLIKNGSGRQVLSGNNTYTGSTVINDGILELSGNGQIFNNPAGITVNGSKGRTGYTFADNQSQTRLGALVLNNLLVDPLGSTPVVLNGGELVHNGNGNGDSNNPGTSLRAYTVQNVTAASGLNTFSNQPFFGAQPLTLGNFTRNVGATVEFKSNFGTLGAEGDNAQVKITNLNGSAFAGNDAGGIVGGWAIAYNGDGAPWDSYWASYDPATGVKAYNGAYAPSVTGAAVTDNVRIDNGTPDTVTADTTVHSLVVRGNNALTIGSGATIKVNSGGVIVTYGDQNQISGAGNLTTGLASGELFLHSYDESYTVGENQIARFNVNAKIVDNGATPTILVKSGYGPLRLGVASTYTGGTRINSGILQIRNSKALGSGKVDIAPGAQLQFGPAGMNVLNDITLHGITPGGAMVGGIDGGTFTNTYLGTLTLAQTSNVSTWWNDKTLVLAGLITGPGALVIDKYKFDHGASVVRLAGSIANEYTGGTILNDGVTLALGNDYDNTQRGDMLGTGPVTINGGSQLRLGGSGGNRIDYTTPNDITLNNGTIFGNDGYQHLTGTITVAAGGGTLNTQWSGKNLSIEGNLTGSGPLTVQNTGGDGEGAIVLTQASDYTGTITVKSGNLHVNGSINGSVQVTGGDLLVNGTVGGSVALDFGTNLSGAGKVGQTTVVGGSIAPGTGGLGTLTTGALILDSFSTLTFELTANDMTSGSGINDLINTIGNLTLDGTLQLSVLGGTLGSTDSYQLFTYTGTLTNLGLDLDQAFLLEYPDAYIDVSKPGQVLLSIPEPSTLTLLGCPALLLGGRRFRRSRMRA